MDKAEFIEKAKKLYTNYKPNSNVVDRLSKLELIAVVGITGVGKSTIIDKSGIPLVLSDMTRAPRKGEKHGIDVWFRQDYDELLKQIKDGYFAQFLVGHTGEFYGTKYSSYPDGGLCTMPIITTALNNFERLGFKNIKTVYILPPSYDEWLERTKMHDDPDIKKRYVEAVESLEYAIQHDLHFIVNDDIDLATKKFVDFANDKYLEEDLNKAKAIAEDLLQNIKSRL